MGGSAGPLRPRSLSARQLSLSSFVVVLVALAALLDGVALLARAEPGLSGLGIGVLGILRLISHVDLRWYVLCRGGRTRTQAPGTRRVRIPGSPYPCGVSADAAPREHKTRSRANPGGMDVLKVLGPDVLSIRDRKPPWFKVQAPGSPRYRELNQR